MPGGTSAGRESPPSPVRPHRACHPANRQAFSNDQCKLMTVAFSRTLRSLEVAGSRWRVAAWLLPLLLMPWLTWFVLGRVTIFEVSQTARLEVESAAHPVDTLVGGQVVET